MALHQLLDLPNLRGPDAPAGLKANRVQPELRGPVISLDMNMRRLVPIAGVEEEAIVICMAADPEPHKAGRSFDRKCPIMTADPSRPEAADLLGMKRRVMRVLFQVRVGSIGEPLDLWRQRTIARPEIR